MSVSTVVHAYNLSTYDIEAEDNEFKTILGYRVRHLSKATTKSITENHREIGDAD